MPRTTPRDWKRALAAVDGKYFEYRVAACESIEHLRAAVAYEADEHGRTDRIARINQRINELQS